MFYIAYTGACLAAVLGDSLIVNLASYDYCFMYLSLMCMVAIYLLYRVELNFETKMPLKPYKSWKDGIIYCTLGMCILK